ncbi:MAG: DUF3143 domain-containing protein [Phormidesmis sp. RL_2_1]|nr:DUF3143 domain-containing protein [Phormidesmis sp. RL_2_1]
MPPANTPLYNHPLPDIETWLSNLGCQRSDDNLSHWTFSQPDWSAHLYLDIDAIVVRYVSSGKDIQRSFKYSLSRIDLEKAIFAGP